MLHEYHTHKLPLEPHLDVQNFNKIYEIILFVSVLETLKTEKKNLLLATSKRTLKH